MTSVMCEMQAMKTKFLQSPRSVKIGVKNGAFDISRVMINREILFWLELSWAINKQ